MDFDKRLGEAKFIIIVLFFISLAFLDNLSVRNKSTCAERKF